MKAQTPAEGIMQTHNWGSCKMYEVVCGCGQPYHSHQVEIEADETSVNVNIYASAHTSYWREFIKKRYDINSIWLQELDWAIKELINGLVNRIKVTWEVWTTGSVKVETIITMTEQQALNYAKTLENAIDDVKKFKEKNKTNKHSINTITKVLAEEGDCV